MAAGGVRGKPNKHKVYTASHVETATARDAVTADLKRPHGEQVELTGRYTATLIGVDGKVKWRDASDNVITTLGRNLLFNAALGASAYTASGYIGVIGSNGYVSAPAQTDTIAQHPGWMEAMFTGNRIAPTWNAASNGSKVTQTVSFNITNVGTMKGLFLVMSTPGTSDASATPGIATGVLFSAGLFSGGDKGPTSIGDRLDVTYSAMLT